MAMTNLQAAITSFILLGKDNFIIFNDTFTSDSLFNFAFAPINHIMGDNSCRNFDCLLMACGC